MSMQQFSRKYSVSILLAFCSRERRNVCKLAESRSLILCNTNSNKEQIVDLIMRRPSILSINYHFVPPLSTPSQRSLDVDITPCHQTLSPPRTCHQQLTFISTLPCPGASARPQAAFTYTFLPTTTLPLASSFLCPWPNHSIAAPFPSRQQT
jgi:hypothetical protein